MMDNNRLPKIALGAWAWGNDGTFGRGLSENELRDVFETAMANGLNLWDTAYAYGMGTSERVLAGFVKDLPRSEYILSDKFTPQCVENPESETAFQDMVTMQQKIFGIDSFDIYWIHNTVDSPKWIEALARYYEGRESVPMIGVSNHDLSEIKEAERILQSHGLRLSAVQNHFSLLNRSSEYSGILDYCRQKGIVFFSYMVLEQGALTGRYTKANPMPEGSARADAYNPLMEELEVLCSVLGDIAKDHGVDTAQIPIAWAVKKGTLPIIGVTKKKHVEDALKALNISLTDEEVRKMEDTASSLGLNTIRFWEKEMK